MAITFELPRDVEQILRARFGDLSEAAKEAFLVQSYREERLSVGQVAAVIGKGVIETQAWLANKGAPLSYSTEELEFETDALLAHPARAYASPAELSAVSKTVVAR